MGTTRKFGAFKDGHCKNGHPEIEKNVGWLTFKRSKKVYFSPTCKRCRADAARLRYQTDAAHRECKKQASAARYHRDKPRVGPQNAV